MRGSIRTAVLAGFAATALALSACGSGTPAGSTSPTETPASGAPSTTGNASTPAASNTDAKTAKSAADFGGMDGLVAAAKAEGALNVIALPHDWANYGLIIEAFKKKYPEITVNEQNPDASSKDEIAAAEANKGTNKAPDVFDVGANIALSSTEYFAPYMVEKFGDIPSDQKEATGLWVSDYTGVMVVGYNKTKFGEITSLDQLTDPKFAGTVALNGKPAEAGAAFNGFLLANLVSGGTFENLQPGLDFFKKLNGAKTLNLTDVTNGTIDAGEHGVTFDWSYNQASHTKRLAEKGVEWATFVPKGITLGSYYKQAINKDAPHPAAARLWQEFLYTAEAQNLWAEGGAVPVLNQLYAAEFTEAAKSAAPPVEKLETPSAAQAEAATKFLAANWDKTIN